MLSEPKMIEPPMELQEPSPHGPDLIHAWSVNSMQKNANSVNMMPTFRENDFLRNLQTDTRSDQKQFLEKINYFTTNFLHHKKSHF